MDGPTNKVILGVGYFKVTCICPNKDKLLFNAGVLHRSLLLVWRLVSHYNLLVLTTQKCAD